jgi:hypothetical protein
MKTFIIVLGNSKEETRRRRVDAAMNFYIERSKNNNRISSSYYFIFSGAHEEAEKMAEYAFKYKGQVNTSNFLLETESRNTHENIENSQKIIFNMTPENENCRVVICTSTFHIKRTSVICAYILDSYFSNTTRKLFIHTNEEVPEELKNREDSIIAKYISFQLSEYSAT